MNPHSVRARFRDDGARNDAQYMSLLGDTLRTQRTAKFPDSAMSEASRARGDGRTANAARMLGSRAGVTIWVCHKRFNLADGALSA